METIFLACEVCSTLTLTIFTSWTEKQFRPTAYAETLTMGTLSIK